MVVQKVVIRQGEARGKEGQRQYMVVLHSVIKPAAQPKTREVVAFLTHNLTYLTHNLHLP